MKKASPKAHVKKASPAQAKAASKKREQRPLQVRMLCGLLSGTEIAVPNTVEARLEHQNMEKLKHIVMHLIAHTDELETARIKILHPETHRGPRARYVRGEKAVPAAKQIAEIKLDPGKVKTLGDVGTSYMMAWLRKRSVQDVAPEDLALINKGTNNIKHVFIYATGTSVHEPILIPIKEVFSTRHVRYDSGVASNFVFQELVYN